MEILYSSPLCSDRKIDSLSSTGRTKPEFAVQKLHKLLANGFVLNKCHIETISPYPVSRTTHSQIFWKKEIEKVDGIEFYYLPFINYPILRQVTIFISGFLRSVFWIWRHRGEERIIICDVLNVAVSSSALIAGRLCQTPVVGIVTDMPRMMITSKKQQESLIEKWAPAVSEKFNHFYTSYVLLTKQMCSIINPYNRPNCVIEGVVDVNMEALEPKKDGSFRNIIYAGGIYEAYGVKQLIDAFRQVEGDDLRLSIYGSGEMEKEMDFYMKLDSRLHYYGTVTNAEVMKAELKATLLINPRFTDAEFTKYSFPSKNLEYMGSGVPLLTTCLPGIPKDYYEYMYVIEDESLSGFVKALSYVVSLPDEELRLKGRLAKEFVLREKNNVYQTKKILEMIRREV